jgi:hypothetical protein
MSFPTFLNHLPRRRDLKNGLPAGTKARYWVSARLNEEPYGIKPDITEAGMIMCHALHQDKNDLEHCTFGLPGKMALPLIIISAVIDDGLTQSLAGKVSDVVFDTWWVASKVRDDMRSAALLAAAAGEMNKNWNFVDFNELAWLLWHGFPPTEYGIKLHGRWCVITGQPTAWGSGKLFAPAGKCAGEW